VARVDRMPRAAGWRRSQRVMPDSSPATHQRLVHKLPCTKDKQKAPSMTGRGL